MAGMLVKTFLLGAATLALLHAGEGGRVVDLRDVPNPCEPTGMAPYDYKQTLCMAYVFYEAQRSGKLPEDQRLTWRGDSALGDGSDVGLDLTGGYFDAGDFVKFLLPQGFTATMIAWGLVDFPQGHEAAGQSEYGRKTLKWVTDFLLKCHTGPYEFYGQVGDGHIDHKFWGRPEEMTMERPSFKIDYDHPGTELVGEAAAALAAASIVFKEDDPAYSEEVLAAAKELYNFGDERRDYYHNSIPEVLDFYKSWSGYGDELAWGALWLYRATNDEFYLERAKDHWVEFNLEEMPREFSWDYKMLGVYALFTMLDEDPVYKDTLVEALNHFQKDFPYTPGGLDFIQFWGSNRHAANVAYVALVASKLGIDADANREWAASQIDYMLGSTGRSFVVGYGPEAPERVHHAAASCPDLPEVCDPDWAMKQPGPNPQTVWGALAGGPDKDGNFVDDREDYVHNEVAIDYNAGYTPSLAGLIELTP
ncbi:endoglucanase E-4-like [Homarus americanus]|uniref:endoglucanase E-4-like n=1 Tax=Homarus americanus TaxID=6706 RepID=UPI001C45A8A2|nr:endoglucanase E-4-like [Homarus americanus]